jgi:fumarate reductase subunit D
MDYPRMLTFAQHWAGKGFAFLVIALFLWHGAHRIFHSLHDLGMRAGTAAKLVCYGVALIGSLGAAYALLAIGF